MVKNYIRFFTRWWVFILKSEIEADDICVYASLCICLSVYLSVCLPLCDLLFFHSSDHLEIEASEELKDEDRSNVICSSRTIFLDVVADLPLEDGVKNKIKSLSEAYRLTIDPDKQCISIIGASSAGVFYGAVSLVSLAKRAEEVAGQGEFYLTGVELVDGPRFEHRGLMIDVARNFRSKEEMTHLIDVISMYKMNRLHLHLTDDEGWRLEIPGLEELTQVE